MKRSPLVIGIIFVCLIVTAVLTSHLCAGPDAVKVTDKESELSGLLGQNVVVYFPSDRNISGKVTSIGPGFLLLEQKGNATKFLCNTATCTYIAIMSRENAR
jgi:hypothetical protein